MTKMDQDRCPGCDRHYELCNCYGDIPTRKAAGGKVTALAVFRAAVKLQQQGLPITTGPDRDWFPERRKGFAEKDASQSLDAPKSTGDNE